MIRFLIAAVMYVLHVILLSYDIFSGHPVSFLVYIMPAVWFLLALKSFSDSPPTKD